jgi:hypothetical protein
MAVQVAATAQLMCSFGVAPSALTVVPKGRPVQAGGQMAATIQDFAPNVNIMPFGMCTTLSNPQVAAATSAALGVLTPQPCIPVTTPWKPGSPTADQRSSAIKAHLPMHVGWRHHHLQPGPDEDDDRLTGVSTYQPSHPDAHLSVSNRPRTVDNLIGVRYGAKGLRSSETKLAGRC